MPSGKKSSSPTTRATPKSISLSEPGCSRITQDEVVVTRADDAHPAGSRFRRCHRKRLWLKTAGGVAEGLGVLRLARTLLRDWDDIGPVDRGGYGCPNTAV